MFDFFKKLFGRVDLNKNGNVDAKDAKVVVDAAKTKAKRSMAKARKSAAKSKPAA